MLLIKINFLLLINNAIHISITTGAHSLASYISQWFDHRTRLTIV